MRAVQGLLTSGDYTTRTMKANVGEKQFTSSPLHFRGAPFRVKLVRSPADTMKVHISCENDLKQQWNYPVTMMVLRASNTQWEDNGMFLHVRNYVLHPDKASTESDFATVEWHDDAEAGPPWPSEYIQQADGSVRFFVSFDFSQKPYTVQ